MQEITLTRPDDWHVHLRDGDALRHTVTDMSRYFGRAIVMPNLTPPVTNLVQAEAYKERILAANEAERCLDPLMVLYLTDNTTIETIRIAAESSCVYGAKLYPAGATTNSDSGVTDVVAMRPIFEAMQQYGLPLLIHGEVTHDDIDIFDREARFIEEHMQRIVTEHPELKVVFEHITTSNAAEFVADARENVGATITAHHLLYNRNHMLAGGIRPHYYCLPILKRGTHQQALIDAATSGNKKFFLGTDSAPHVVGKKESSCGCAGAYTAHAAIEMYAEVFDEANALDKLEGFASFHGPDFYGLPRNTDTITLRKQNWLVPESMPLGDDVLRPLRAGEEVYWAVI